MRTHDSADRHVGSTGPTAAGRRQALAAVIPHLRCPVCAGELRLFDNRVVCDRAHAFDVARQGYVNLISGRAGPGTADSADMVTARDRFLGGGHYKRVADAAASLVAQHDPDGAGLLIDLAGGTGYYLAHALYALPERDGLCLDLSAPALRRAARAHPRGAAIGADVWQPLPLATGCAAHVLSVFGPRNAAEISRVLIPGGTLTIAAPGPAHMGELRERLGLIGIDERKRERIADAFHEYGQVGETGVRFDAKLDHADLTALVAMGPSARHIAPADLAGRVAPLPASVTVTIDVQVTAWRRRYPDPARSTNRNRDRDEAAGQEQS
jgi:23S rRNA (guanine745-N1)-methyltransferase